MKPNNLEFVNVSRRSGEENNLRSNQRACLKEYWSPSEDAKLKEIVGRNGPQNWNLISEQFPGRSGKSCRKRWLNNLDPTINKQPFTEEEEFRLIAAQRVYGNKWAKIARHFQGRTDNAIRNCWNVMMYRWAKQRQQGMVSFSGRYSNGGSDFATCTTELSLTPPSTTYQPRFLNFSNTLSPGYNNGQYMQRAEENGLHQNHHKVAMSEGKVELRKTEGGVYFYDFLEVGHA